MDGFSSIGNVFEKMLDFLSEGDQAFATHRISPETPLGGQCYPYLARSGGKWLLTSTLADSANRFANGQLMRWVNGNNVHDLWLDRTPYSENALAEKLGLNVNLKKGGFVMSKRWSRLMRPYLMYMFVNEQDLHIQYLNKDAQRDKVWDGAGLVSRAMLNRMSHHLTTLPLSDRLRRKLQHELKTCKRIEFTVQGRAGQDKGHAIVSETLDADFLLIQDTKRDVQATDGQVMIGFNPVHHHTQMRLDVQSLVNLRGDAANPFWTNEQLLTYLHDTSTVFQQALVQGDVTEAMSLLDGQVSLEAIQAWHLREYFASGGQTMAFAAIIKSLMNQHLTSIRATNLENMRLPIVGGRFYVMPCGVGQAAGLSLKVRRGHVLLDESSSTAWVNDRDWLKMHDSPHGAGIAKILGGADNDDALWCYPFTDHDGQRKILCWRSPNQHKEYVLLRPETGCAELTWYDGTNTTSYPPNDSRKLPPRIDTVEADYLDLVIADRLIEDVPYSIEAMNPTLHRIQMNEGALGMYCNLLMLVQALYGQQPKAPAARLEAIIDASVKTGDDLSQIKQYCYDKSRVIVDTGCALPKVLWKRLSIQQDPQQPAPKLTPTHDHWLDQLVNGIMSHISTVEAARNALMAQAQPPLEIFQYAQEHALLEIGGRFNTTYATALQPMSQTGHPNAYDRARQRCEHFLVTQRGTYSPEAILLGALANCYLNHNSDAAVWQPGAPGANDSRQAGIANLTLQALRSIGVLDSLKLAPNQMLKRYPSVVPQYRRTTQIDLNGVWFNYLNAKGLHYKQMSDVEALMATQAKQDIAQLAAEKLSGYTLDVHRENGSRLVVYGPQGHLFAYIAKQHEAQITGNRLRILTARAHDGNLQAVCEFV